MIIFKWVSRFYVLIKVIMVGIFKCNISVQLHIPNKYVVRKGCIIYTHIHSATFSYHETYWVTKSTKVQIPRYSQRTINMSMSGGRLAHHHHPAVSNPDLVRIKGMTKLHKLDAIFTTPS